MVVVTTKLSRFGRVLVTGSGMSLYVFTGDGVPQIACTALNKAPDGTTCTAAWPPLRATGRLVARGGVHQAGLGTVTRNHVRQVTYFGHPLYGFVGDAAGQMNGENYPAFKGQWYLDLTSGRPAIGVASVMTERSRIGTVLAGRTALGRRTLYTLSFDTPNKTTCTGACAAFWPPLLTSGPAKAGPGVSQRAIGTLRRPDGTSQVTYHGHPVYMFAFDLGAGAAPGLTNGEYLIDPAANGVWYTVTPRGTPDPGRTTVGSEHSGTRTILAITAGLTHATATLYAFSIDTATMSKCTGACAKFWPPVLTTGGVKAGPGVSQHMLGTLRRADGTTQVSYNGHPLYFFAFGLNSGTSGAGAAVFGGVFNLVNTDGTVGGGGGW